MNFPAHMISVGWNHHVEALVCARPPEARRLGEALIAAADKERRR